MSSEKIIEIKNLYVKYDKETILEDVNLTIKKGDFVAILGPNGAGKTTIIKTILGVVKPFKGEVKIFGKFPEELKLHDRAKIGYVPQFLNANPLIPLRVYDVIKLGTYPKVKKFSKLPKEISNDIESAINTMQINDIKWKLFRNLSGGQKQRTLIARALSLKPEILILDEPATGLDYSTSEGLYHMLKRLHEEFNLTIIMVTHDVMMVSEVVDKIACLNKKLIVHGKPAEVLTSTNLECLYGKNAMLFGHDDVHPHIFVSRKPHGGS